MIPNADSDDIANLNDEFRAHIHPDWQVSTGIYTKGQPFLAKVASAVRDYDSFTEETDPFGEHDSGVIRIEDSCVHWRIECLDLTQEGPSPDPASPEPTVRVMWIMMDYER